jgi:hypothetical protein
MNDIIGSSSNGIFVRDSLHTLIIGNIIDDSSGYDLRFDSAGVIVYLNALLTDIGSNFRLESLRSGIWDNQTFGNYWFEYDGIDEDLNGIGDSPFELQSGHSDNYPLMDLTYIRIFRGEMDSPEIRIFHDYTPEEPQFVDIVTVHINITYPDLVEEVILTYSVDGGSIWTNVTAAFQEGEWRAIIPEQSEGTVVRYKIYVRDDKGNWIESITGTYTVHATGMWTMVNLFAVGSLIAISVVGVMIYKIHKDRKKSFYDYSDR